MDIEQLHIEGLNAASRTTNQYLAAHGDRDACGFAWVSIYGVKGSTKIGKKLISLGFRKSYEGGLQYWNPSGSMTQCITAKEEGANAYAKIFKDAGFEAYMGSRMD